MFYIGIKGNMENIERLKKVGKALSNDHRIQIIKLCSEREHNITDLKKELGISYQHVHNHVYKLKDADLVETYRKTDSKGKSQSM